MEGAAFLFMILSWGLILGLNLFCFTMLFTKSQQAVEEDKRLNVNEYERDEIT